MKQSMSDNGAGGRRRGYKMKKKTIIAVCAVLAVIALGAAAYAAIDSDYFFSTGKYYREAIEKRDTDPEIVATFNEHEIYRSAVDYMRQMNVARSAQEAKKYGSDRDIIDRLVENILILEEAEKRGLAATDEEIEQMVNSAKMTYEMPSGKEYLDRYCEGAGITIDEYYDILREQAPRTIARQKLKNEIGRAFCEENGLEYTNQNPPAGMLEAEEQFIQELFKANRGKIKYYVD